MGDGCSQLLAEKPEARVACGSEVSGVCCMGLPAAVVCVLCPCGQRAPHGRYHWCRGDLWQEKGWD